MRQITWRKLLSLMLAVGLAVGCAGGKPKIDNKPLTQAELDAMIKQKVVTDPFLRSQQDFGLDARRTGANRVQATVTNKTTRPVMVGPNRFGAILPGQRKIMTTEPKSIKLFPVTNLGPGEQASGELTFPVGTLPANARLAFDAHDGSQPAMAPIR